MLRQLYVTPIKATSDWHLWDFTVCQHLQTSLGYKLGHTLRFWRSFLFYLISSIMDYRILTEENKFMHLPVIDALTFAHGAGFNL